jgi:energy-coupling factor transporter ATP-binding protein EcfA2
MKLTKLKIHKYRDVAPGDELVFNPSLNLVLGENGTGRTMLLDLLSTVLASDFSGLIREEFSLEYDLAFPGMEIHVSVRNERPSTEARGGHDSREDSALLRLRAPKARAGLVPLIEAVLQFEAPASRLVMRADASGLACELDGKSVYSQSMHWSVMDRTVWVLLFMTAQYLEPEVKDRLKELLRRTFLLAPTRFDESLGMFERMGNIQYGMELREGEVFPLNLMAVPTWLPGLLRERVERKALADVITIRHDEVERSFLAKFVALAGFTAGTFRMELSDKRVQGGGRLEFSRFGFDFTRRDGSVLTQEHLGFGQKRLLSFLYYLDLNEDFVIVDELANGLHPRAVEACLREIDDRQAFLTTQNPLLLEHVPLGSAEDVRSWLILCGAGLHLGHEQRVWSHPTEEAAAKLFRSFREGTTSLGALLRAQGLW